MTQKRTYRVEFFGRKIGAIGITYKITEVLDCPFNRMLHVIYNKYEHCYGFQVHDITEKPEQKIDTNLWRADQVWALVPPGEPVLPSQEKADG